MALKQLAFSQQTGIRLGLIAAGFALVMSISGTVMAAAAVTSCDPQYMDALESRAYLEAQREIAMNQNLIFKPDSVLEYTCFDKIMGTVARASGDRGNFSESNRWGEIPNHDTASLDRAFDTVVTSALTSYISTNFGHTYLGGRTAINSNIQSVTGNAGVYNCSEMLKVWNAARCMNFMDKPGQDGFHDFEYLKSNDPRQLPSACPNNGITAQWIDRAFNNKSARYVLTPENPLDATPYTDDPMTTYLSKINPLGVAPAAACADPVPTGVIVFRQGFAPEYYYEKVCPNPGCYYVPSGVGTSAAPSDTGACQ